jgi:hypothetical protein
LIEAGDWLIPFIPDVPFPLLIFVFINDPLFGVIPAIFATVLGGSIQTASSNLNIRIRQDI